MNAVVSNNNRKYRASRGDGVGIARKGNHFSTSTNGKLHRDVKPSFPQLHPRTGEILPYAVAPYEEIGGVFFDVARPAYRGRTVKAGQKSAPKPSARKARTRRQDPGAGTRPSLSTMRRKG